MLKIVETNSGLGYQEVAYFVEIPDKNEYLCIFENQDTRTLWATYEIGKTYELEAYEIDVVIPEKHSMVLDKSPLAKTFLFNEFLKSLKDRKWKKL